MADEAKAEELVAEHPEEAMRRREFLGRTAALAGSASLAGLLPAERVVAEAARAQARRALPGPGKMPIDNFVVLMMENRSFDHYFGWHPTADGKNKGLKYPDANGHMVKTHHLPPDFQGCAFRDPDHSWEGGRHQYNHGRNDGFVQGNDEGTGSDSFAAGYYLRNDLGALPGIADKYTLYDRWFCSILASTYPNRHYQWGAQSGGHIRNDLPTSSAGFEWETIFDRATKHGISVGYYASDIPFAALYGTRALPWIKNMAQFYADCEMGTLPQIAFVDPGFAQESMGTSTDEHPFGDVRLGQAFMADVANAFVASPQYRRGAMFIDYDEWGGFFDHVKPQFVPDDRATKQISTTFGLTGFRIPGIAISPYTRGGRVSHMPITHESILKLISYRFRLGHLNKRHRYATNIGRSFNWAKPNFDPPELPDPVASRRCRARRSATEARKSSVRSRTT
jgi:phospholipase C